MHRLRAVLLGALTARCSGFGFVVPVGEQVCFHESANAGERIAGEWNVVSGGMLDLDVTVTSPGKNVHSALGESLGSFAFHATEEGVHAICFANQKTMSPQEDKHVWAKISVGEPPDLVEVARAEHLTPIEERIKRLHDSMITVRDLQDQMREQDETTHRVTRSTRSWLLWFSVLEACVLGAVSLWQILSLKPFFEVRRVV